MRTAAPTGRGDPGAGPAAALRGELAAAVTPPADVPEGWTWRPVGPLPGRQGHVATWTGTEIVYWGGERPGRSPEGAAYDPASGGWRRLARSPLANRTGAAAAWTGREVLVWGGVNGGGLLADGAGYDPSADRWRPVARAPLTGRVPLASAWTGTQLVVAGARGLGLADGINDAATYDPVTNLWRGMHPVPVHVNIGASTWTGRELIMYGAFVDRQRAVVGSDGRAQGAALDPTTGEWRALPAAPLSGQAIALAWDGTEVIAWDHARASAAFEPATNRWRPLPDLPLEGRDCLPEGVTAGRFVYAIHCGQAAIFDRQRGTWQATPSPPAATDAPVWTGDEVVLWLGPSGRPDDGTWTRRLPA